MRCSVCQSINEDDANFCRTCGATVAHPPQPTGPLPPPAPPRHSPDPLWAQTVPSASPDQQWADSVQASAPPPDAYPDADVAPTLAVPIEPAMATADVRRTVAFELAARRRRNRALLVAGAFVVAAACGAVAVFALGGDAESTKSTLSTGSTDPATDSALPVVTTVAPIGLTTVAPNTSTTATIPPTPTVTTQAATTVAVVVASPPSTVAPTVTSAPPAPTAATTPATVAPTVAPTTAAPAPVTTAVPTPAGTGDLGLSIPISKPACDGQYITLIGASVDTPGVAGRVNGLLNQYPGSKYLKSELVCGSLNPRSADGEALYIVFFGPFASTADACAARSKGTKDSYVKVLENTPEPAGAEKC